LPIMYLDFRLGCAKAETKNLERMGHASSDHGAEIRIIEPSFWFVMGLCGVGCGAWGRSGVLGCSSSSSSVVSSSLSEVSSFGVDPLVARRACQDGKGPQSAGRSGVGVLGCNSRSTSWFQ
jgi:hypothetical protein